MTGLLGLLFNFNCFSIQIALAFTPSGSPGCIALLIKIVVVERAFSKLAIESPAPFNMHKNIGIPQSEFPIQYSSTRLSFFASCL